MGERPPVICVVGPTASGKTELAQQLALALDGEVVSADSMQVYRGMDIGTGKLPASERAVPHHGIDIVDPDEPYSAALFQAYARAAFTDIAARGKRAILAGGTGFYVRAAVDAYDFPPGEQVGNPLRDALCAFLEEHGADALWRKLADADTESAQLIHRNDTKRVMRALELHAAGESYAAQRRALPHIAQAVPAVMIGLQVDPEALRERIDARVDRMREAGLVDEVRALVEAGFRESITAPQAIGYKEVVAALDGCCTMDEAFERIKLATRRYAKRQRTWFRKDARIQWIDAGSREGSALLADALALAEAGSSSPEGKEERAC